jgi:hypothetical protein
MKNNSEFCIIYNSLSKEMNDIFDDLKNNTALKKEFSKNGIRVEKKENYVIIYTEHVSKGILNRVLKNFLKLRVIEEHRSDLSIVYRLDEAINDI